MNRRWTLQTTCAAALTLLAGCGGERLSTAPGPMFGVAGAAGMATLPGIYFLPPLDSASGPYTGAFDPSLQPVVEIVDGTGGVTERLSVAGTGSARVRVSAEDEQYIVNWQNRTGATYRVRLLVNGVQLGITTVAAGKRTWPVKFRIEQGASSFVLAKVAGDGQSAAAGAAVPVAPAVRLTNARGDTIADMTVSFTVAAGGGTVTGAEQLTDGSGLATVGGWTLGPTPGSNMLTATAGGANATFTAEARRSGLVQVAAGWWHTCSLAGSGQAYCWGYGSWGESGDGTQVTHASPVAVLGGLSFTQITVMTNHVCGLDAAGHAYCWGGNGSGQLGTDVPLCPGNYPCSTSPVPVNGSLTFTQIVGGYGHTCGLDHDGRAYCWGYNHRGQLGNGTWVYTAPLRPVVGNLAFTQLAAGRFHTCGLTASGQAWCWGLNGSGQLGSQLPPGSPWNSTPTPVPVAGGLSFTQLAIGTYSDHSCALTSSGRAYCWGNNTAGALGDGSTTSSWVPVAVAGGLTFTQLTGGSHTCGLTAAGAAYCWGDNYYGQLGNATRTNSAVPVAVTGSLRFTQLASGEAHTCGLTADGIIWCWGFNGHGELGNGSTADQSSPVQVSAVP